MLSIKIKAASSGESDIVALVAYDTKISIGVLTLHECAAIYAGGKFDEISELSVEPQYRSKGAGRKLPEAASNEARSRCWKRIDAGAQKKDKWVRTADDLWRYILSGFLWWSVFCACGLLFVTVPATAKWSIEPSLKTQISHSNNVGLASEKRKQDVIYELTPDLWLKGEGRRYKLNVFYRMQNLFYTQEKKYDITNHKLEAVATGEILRDRVFIEAEAHNFQQYIKNHPGIFMGYTLPGNRADITTARLSPFIRHDFGNSARMLLRYTHEQTRIEKLASDGISRRYDLSLANKQPGRRIVWNLNYKKKRVERSGSFLMDQETAVANLRYRFGRRISFLARGGSENHDLGFSTDWTQKYESGNYWAAGINWHIRRALEVDTLYGDHFKLIRTLWKPSRRTILEINWSDKDYGLNSSESWRGDISIRFRHSVWLTSYNEDVVTVQQSLGERGLFSFRDQDTGQLVPGEIDTETGLLAPVYLDPDTGERTDYPDGGKLAALVMDDFGLLNETYIRKRGQSVYGWKTTNDTATALLFYERRNYLEGGGSDSSYGVYATWKHRLDHVYEVLFGSQYQHRIYRFTRFEGDIWSVEAGVLKKLGGKSTASCMYSYLERDTYNEGNRYNESRISCYVKLTL